MSDFGYGQGKSWRRVNRDEFRAFLSAYPGKIEHSATTICDPVFHGYYDFTKAKSPEGTPEHLEEAIQAKCWYADERGGEDEFWIHE